MCIIIPIFYGRHVLRFHEVPCVYKLFSFSYYVYVFIAMKNVIYLVIQHLIVFKHGNQIKIILTIMLLLNMLIITTKNIKSFFILYYTDKT